MSWVERPKEIRQKIKCLGAGASGVPRVTFCLQVHMSLFLAFLNIEDNSSMHLCFAMLNKKNIILEDFVSISIYSKLFSVNY